MNYCNHGRVRLLKALCILFVLPSTTSVAANLSTTLTTIVPATIADDQMVFSDQLYQQSVAQLSNQPGIVSHRYQQLLGRLSQTPAWYQRDWHLLAARAYTAQKQWDQAWRSLQLADELVPQGILAAEIALTAGFVAYQQQYRQLARHWFLCADRFDNPPLTRAKLLLNLGTVEAFRGDFTAAARFYQQGFELAEQHEFQQLLPMFQNNMGTLYWRTEQYEAAVSALRQATFGYARLQQSVSQSRAGINLLNVLVTIEDWARYERFFLNISRVVQQTSHTEFKIFLQIMEVVRHRLTGQGSAMTDQALLTLVGKLQNLNLQHMSQRLLVKIGVTWEPPAVIAEPEPAAIALVNTELRCQP